MHIRWLLAAALCGSLAWTAFGQENDAPSFRTGATIFGDYTYNESPVHNSAFNVSRAYINVTGNLNRLIAYRITPDVARESGSGSSLTGSLTFRLKYAFGQFNLDDWTTKGSWVRFGLQQTPFIDYNEGIYRYRFQGPTFEDREGLFPSSDFGLSAHWTFPAGRGDVHAGLYNGEGYNKAETNNEKAFHIRGSVRAFKGLRVTGYAIEDHYAAGAIRQRYVGQITFEHPWVNAGADYAEARDQTSATQATVTGSGGTFWITPRLGATGWEMLLRHDAFKPNRSLGATRRRNIAGIAYWFQHLHGVQSALMADYDRTTFPGKPDDTRYGLKMLINF